MKIKIAHIAVQRAAHSITEIYDAAPHEIVLEGLLDCLGAQADQIGQIRKNAFDDESSELMQKALEIWDEDYGAYLNRLDEYRAAFDGGESSEDIQAYVLDPLLDGEFSSDMNIEPPPWGADLQSGFRLCNDLAQMIAIARPKDTEIQSRLAEDFKRVVDGLFKSLEDALTEPLLGASSDPQEESTIDWAKRKAQEARDAISDYVKLKKIQESAKKYAPVIMGSLGLAAIVLLARRQ
jgi:hypothetical protein